MSNDAKENKVTLGNLIALGFAIVFFSGLLKSNEWWGLFDFTTLNGAFGRIGDLGSFRGSGGGGARDGFIFAFTLVPTVMFAMAMIEVLEHFGALDAARKLLSYVLRPVLGVPGESALALIASLQSTDAGSSITRGLLDEGKITKDESDTFTMFQFSGGAMLVNFFSSGAVLFTLTNADGSPAVTASIGLCVAVMFIMKIVGANLMRFGLRFSAKKKGDVVESKAAAARG
ncbi:nucleoside recognition domain-containing protein [Sansalvadorimonas verongulae]|uniref:nucleoside recognition domain-containing protein n=1 Tax=Sansalvadorimonas verongulae TaxID=2172824 RepID=UPI0012BD7C32|nr:nucleoside recognition domain-containing protein [Sansalvadorimonas verongulae]MTI13273.1 YjiH family protein [Sansalvadorimonas verongulae]